MLIAGASGGIGSATALLLARAGAQVILSGRDTEKLETLASQIEFAAGSEAPIVAADLTDAAQVSQLTQQAAEQYGGGKLDVVINAAGVGAIKSIEALTPEDFQTLLSVNLYGAMLLSQAAVKVMAPHKTGHILHVVGILGKAPMANATAYCASKYGLSGFLAALRAEVARRFNLKVTALYLGGVDTPFYDNPAIEMKVQRDKMLSVNDASEAIFYALTQPSHLVMGELTLQPDSHQL
ncbi:MAG: SDR family oxidoreductase [Cytophagales bacterium]|nr:SDR family oxidoreductase [Armatimonadota bacterium]